MATFDPDSSRTSSLITLSNGNLTATRTTGSGNGCTTIASTDVTTNRKIYIEFTLNDANDSTWLGVMRNNSYATDGGAMGSRIDYRTTSGAISEDASWWVNNSITHSSAASGDVVMFAVDLVNGKIWIGVNGTWPGSGDPANGTNPGWTYWEANVGQPITNFTDWMPYILTVSSTDAGITANFGASSFSYTAPTGFSSWNGTTQSIVPLINSYRRRRAA